LFIKRTTSILLSVLFLSSHLGISAKGDGNLVHFQENFENGNTTYTISRNNSGEILQTKVGNQVLSTNIYDDKNSLPKNTTYANGHTVNFSYDNSYNLIKKGYRSNDKNSVFEYSYNDKDQLIRSSNSESNTVTNFSYDVDNRLSKILSTDGTEKMI